MPCHTRFKKALFCLLPFIVFTLAPTNSQAQRDTVKENRYIAQLRAMDAGLAPAFVQATAAMDEGKFKLADSLFTIVHQGAPQFSTATRRLGSVKNSLGEKAAGMALVEQALGTERSYANLTQLAEMLIYSGESDEFKQTPNLNRALDLLGEAQTLPGADEYECLALRAEAQMNLNRKFDFASTTSLLLTKYNDKVASHYFAAILAANDEEWTRAEDEILKAKALGFPAENAEAFLDSGIRRQAMFDKAKVAFLWILLAWALGFVVLYVLGLLLSNYTLSAIERQFKNNSGSKLAHSLRSFYRFLINFAGVYYYISLPIILVLLVALVVGIFYLFLSIGHIPIKLMLLIVIGAGVSIFGMIRSLLLRIKAEDPGRELKESEAPALFALTREVAQTMGTRPINEIRITPETDLAVYETGSWRQKLADKGKRILILGAGVLKDFKQDDFKAVLAHEYGHFSHRDTAGGAVALRVRNDIHKYYVALYNAGQAVYWNLAFLFIRLYNFIFYRISNGATRLQEVLADRVAAQTYGAQAFENGLTYVVRRNIEFVKLAKVEIESAREVKRPFNNLYELADNNATNIEEEVQKSLNRKTSEHDTHPSPVDRFRYIKGIGEDKVLTNNVYVRDLFTDWNAITAEMTQQIEDSWKKPGEE